MSAKWRALQHRHRYTYSAIIFPHYYKQTLADFTSPDSSSARAFYAHLTELVSLNSTYTQLNHAKKLAAAFTELLKNDNENVVSHAARFYLEILFLENSVPLHRTLVSVLAKTREFQAVIGSCFRSLCEEYADVNANAVANLNSNGSESWKGKRKRFCVSRVGLSMMSTPKLGYLVEVVEECAVLIGLDVVSGLNSVVCETNDWSRPSPIVMEQCQDALSCIYYLLQRCPLKFGSVNESCNFNVMEMILSTILSVLKSEAFSRDCFVAAGVAFCAALQVCLCPEELGVAIIEGIFHRDLSCSNTFQDVVMKIPYKGNLFSEIGEFCLLSRLCLIRGILTSVPRTLLNTPFVRGCEESEISTILYDGILPELCKYCENPIDSHFNFHALTVMQICLQQIKTLMLTSSNSDAKHYDPISDDISGRILRIIWNNLEDPLSQTVKQVHLIFDIFLDIQSSLSSTDGKERIQLFLRKIASNLLRMGSRCKGRYVPLASVTKRLGAKTIVEMSPDLMFETAWAYVDDDVCCAATTFLKSFLLSLRDEFWSSDGVENGYIKYRNVCLPPFLHGLASGNSKLRSNLNTYAFPVILEVDVESIFPMLAFISIGPVGEDTSLNFPDVYGANMDLRVEQKVAVLVSLLKVSRSLALIEGDVDRFENGDYAILCVKGIKVKVLVKWLVLALTHVDESLRTDAVESLFLNPKTASLPSSLELSMMKESMPLNMRCSSTSFQMKLTSLFRKFFSRVRTALERQIKQGTWQPLQFKQTEDASFRRAEDLFRFMKWLSCFLFFSCYPSAPYERKIMAMELILIMNNTWLIVQDSACESALMTPYDAGFTSSEATLLLVGSIVDSWDRLRENSFRILLYFPTPLPGISTTNMVEEVIIWAKKLVYSPRVRESDAGALTMRLLFRKYVLDLGWAVKASCNAVSLPSQNILISPVVEYVTSLIDWLHDAVEMGEKDLSDACRNSFVHGVLLTLRYTFEEMDWNSNIVLNSVPGMKIALEKLLELVMRITSMALSVVSADAWHLPEDMEDIVNDESYEWEANGDVDVDVTMPAAEQETTDSKVVQDVGPSDQVVMVGCWLAMKEVSLLLGTIIRKVPLPTSDISGPNINDDAVLDFKQLETIGNHFLEVLMKMKHNGAIDKTRAGFTALCNRLLCSDNPRLGKLTESWMEQLMERTVAKEQTVDDLLRRSAGIPAAFIAFFLSEPEGAPKRLLPRALRWLIDVANRSMMDQNETKTIFSAPEDGMDDNIRVNSKIRDEGVIPTVHAFNVLRAAFNDTNLSTDTSGFSAEAMIIAIRSFSSAYWEVRNSACNAYTALVRRMIGFLNVQKRESARRALTGLEFFHRYPSLHPFLYSELKIATELLIDNSPQHLGSNLAKAVHPSLCPMLILLSRLKPSAIASESGDVLDPFLFMPFIRSCSTQSNLRVRVLASRALTGLISNEKLPVIMVNVASELPSGRSLASSNMIHGLLLQLISLLDINCRNLADFFKKDQILDDMIKILVTRSWIGNPKLCPCSTLNTSYLRVLDIMLSISRTCDKSKSFNSICKLLCELSSECLDADASFGLPYYDPTVAECRKQAATSYFNCVFQTSKDVNKEDTPMSWKQKHNLASGLFTEMSGGFTSFQKRLIRSLSDASYEVRIATLKWLLLFLKAADFDDLREDQSIMSGLIKWINLHLHTEMVNLLSLENNHRCTCYILKILFTWNMLNFQKVSQCLPDTRFVGNIETGSLFLFWDELVSLYKLNRHVKTREINLCCMGVCVKQFANMFMSSFNMGSQLSKVYDCISYYVDLVKQHADASEPVNIRKAAAESVVASGLLQTVDFIGQYVTSNLDQKEVVYTYASRTLDMWSVCIKLLEDEDVSLRSKLAIDVQKCFTSEKSGVIPSQVDKVIISSFEHLSSIFGNWINYFDYLSNWILSASNNVVSRGDLVRRVFDKEIDNHHEEKLLLCQICCFHLENLTISKSLAEDENGGLNFLHDWRMRFFQRLMSFAVDHDGKQTVNWIGGLGNHKDAFLPVYSNLLGVYTLSRCILMGILKNHNSMQSEMADLGVAIKPFLGNPLIQNLFLSVVRLHEDHANGNVAVWDSFDPYFLLR